LKIVEPVCESDTLKRGVLFHVSLSLNVNEIGGEPDWANASDESKSTVIVNGKESSVTHQIRGSSLLPKQVIGAIDLLHTAIDRNNEISFTVHFVYRYSKRSSGDPSAFAGSPYPHLRNLFRGSNEPVHEAAMNILGMNSLRSHKASKINYPASR
jgi:hypothetical protein